MKEGNPYELKVKKWRKRRRVVAIVDQPLEVYDKETGEIKTATPFVGGDRFRDTTDFVKVYEPKMLIGMSKTAYNVLLYMMSRMNFEGYVEFKYAQCKKEIGYKDNKSIYNAICELVKKDIIRPKDEGGYWFNPNIIYRGQRTGFEPDEQELSHN